MWDPETGSLDLATLRSALAGGSVSAEDVIGAVYDRIAARGKDPAWITLVPREDAMAEARRGDPGARLFGIPFGIKDNVDLAGYPSTAGVRAWARTPEASSPLVDTFRRAGAIPIGKNNQDQLGMGLVGVRTDFGIPSCVFSPDHISGGSSSGGGVSVAAGLVSFAVANDAAGSGRVPAALNNIVGYKPTPGLVPRSGATKAGMVGTETVLTLTVSDAADLSNMWFRYDLSDPFSKPEAEGFALTNGAPPERFVFAVPDAGSRIFDGDPAAEALFDDAVSRLVALGGTAKEVDMAPLLTAARLLYDGPYIAQRYANFRDRFDDDPGALHPATAEILSWGRNYSAADLFEVQYRMAGYRQYARALFAEVDVLLTPTTPTTYRIDQVNADNIALNAKMGTYTNFANLLDLPSISVPAGFRPDGIALGAMLTGPSLGDDVICRIGAAFHASLGIQPGLAGKPGRGMPGSP